MRRSFLSVLVLASLIVGVESCKKGDTGPAGPAGPTGAAGANGAAGAAGATGVKGADGTIIRTGTGAPTAATPGAINDFYLDTNTGILYGPRTATAYPTTGVSLRGATGANGANGATGAAGANGANGATGATGAAGTNFIAGPNAPTGGQGKDGDTYFATTTSTLYGPKVAGAWPATGTAIGVTATPRVFFLDVKLDGDPINTIATFHDTALTLDPSRYIQSSHTLNRVDVEQRIAGYPGWSSFNGREVLFTDVALTTTGQYLMVPTANADFLTAPGGVENVVGRTFVYTKDPKNAKYVAIIRRAGQLAGLTMTTNPSNPLPATASPNPVNIPASGVPYAGGGLRYGRAATAITPANIAQAIIDLGLTASDAQPVQQYTFSLDDYTRLTSSPTTPGGTSTYNALCYWMYAEAAHSTGAGSPDINNKSFAINSLVDFFPVWMKAAQVNTGSLSDYIVKKTYNFNTGSFYRNTTLNAAGSAMIDPLAKAWSASRATGSIDFHFMYGTPAGHAAAGNMASQGSINPALTTNPGATVFVPGVTGSVAAKQYAPGAVTLAGPYATNPMAYGAPIVAPAASYPTYNVQNLYNTWISLNDDGVSGNPGGTIGGGNGSGAANDYNTVNGAHGDVYFLTTPAYEYSTFVAVNGGTSFPVTSPYGNYNVPAPTTTPEYPYTGIWLQNGVLQVNYNVYNGGTGLRLTGPEGTLGAGATIPFGATPYSYNWTGPKGYIGASGVAPNAATYWPVSATTGGSYTDGPWPSNQNTACEGYYFKGVFIPTSTPRTDDIIIKLKIQTIPSNNPTDAPIQLKAGNKVK
ncbi:hypothetical protein [Niabella hibiscisoli]|uniref:hypothetical protein n=1 Tax=Niabella hibiscisoli TaxID=1825928 RepID=UPI001F0DB665|nr:hypothetical protein [Niabella hibiscisoli]MCH5718089.1 hypothetical protein [Niabella hibiscisoli]